MSGSSDADRDVLSSLPRSRPARRSAKRDGATATATGAPEKAAKPKPAKPKPNPAKPKPKPKAAAEPAPATTPAELRSIGTAPSAGARAGAEDVPPAGWSTPGPARETSPDLLTTAVQAAAEVVQLSTAVGKHAVKSVLGRLPRP